MVTTPEKLVVSLDPENYSASISNLLTNETIITLINGRTEADLVDEYLTYVNIAEPLEDIKTAFIEYSKIELAKELETAVVYSDCHQGSTRSYSVSLDKQNLLSNEINSAYIAKLTNNTEFKPTWNSAGAVATTDWTLEELIQLSNTIRAFVTTKVNSQRTFEISINESTSREEILGWFRIHYNTKK